MKLDIAKGFALDQSIVTKTVAILAQRRKGKTYTASVLAEEMVEAGIPWVAIDPTGAWWGLRSSATGKSEGLPVTILGGDHGDVPLERTAGGVVADLVVESPGWYVLDLSHFESKAAERQFATDFAERFYRRKNKTREAIHLFIDEADMFVPQQSPSGDQRMLGAFEAIVRRGGIRGIGVTLISQRAAVVNKNVLEQIDILIVLRTVGPNDQKAIKGYVDANGTPEERDALMTSLASLKLGEAWVWEPGAEPALFERVQIRERDTLNSSATPEAGGVKVEAKKMAEVDLEALTEKMAETIEKQKLDDPKALRAENAKLKSELHTERAKPPPTPAEPELVEVPVFPEKLHDNIKSFFESLKTDIQNRADEMKADVDHAAGHIADWAETALQGQGPEFRRRPVKSPSTTVSTTPPATPPKSAQSSAQNGEVKLNRKAERMILSALIQYPEGLTVRKLAIITGYAKGGGGFRGALSKLRTVGYIDGRDPLVATDAGRAAMPEVDFLPTGRDLFEHWVTQAKRRAEREVLRVVYEAYPNALTAEQIAAACENEQGEPYDPAGGGFRGALSKWRTLDLIEGRGEIKASADLF